MEGAVKGGVMEDESPPALRSGRIEAGNGIGLGPGTQHVELALTLPVVRS